MRSWRRTSSDSSPRSTSSWPLAQRRLDRRGRPGGRVPPRPSARAELGQLPACVGRQRPPEFITSLCSPKRWDGRLAAARSHETRDGRWCAATYLPDATGGRRRAVAYSKSRQDQAVRAARSRRPRTSPPTRPTSLSRLPDRVARPHPPAPAPQPTSEAIAPHPTSE